MANKGCAQIRTKTAISMLQWHHIVAVRVGKLATDYKIYVDGTLQETEVATYGELTTGDLYNYYNGRLIVGNGSGSGSLVDHFIGYIRNVKVYNRAIEPTVVSGNYNNCNGEPTNTTGLVLWSKLDEGSGTAVTDHSTYNTHGELAYATGWGGGVGQAVAPTCIIPANSTLCNTTTTTLVKSKGYRYGFNGKENDNEIKGEGMQLDYGFRIYDPRLCRFLSVDPLFKSYPELTPYQFASNTPIEAIDLDGLEAESSKKDGFLKSFGKSVLRGVANTVSYVANNPNHAGYSNGVQPNTGKPPTQAEIKRYDFSITQQFDPTFQIQNFSSNLVYGTTNFIGGIVDGDGARTAQAIPPLLGSLGAITPLIGSAKLSGLKLSAELKPGTTVAGISASMKPARMALAQKYFSGAGKSASDVDKLMGTIDFSKAVKETIFNAGDKVWRFERIGSESTEKHFFTNAYGADAGATGVGFDNASGYKLVTYEVTEKTTVMESTIRGTKNKQFFSTDLQKNIKKVGEE